MGNAFQDTEDPGYGHGPPGSQLENPRMPHM